MTVKHSSQEPGARLDLQPANAPAGQLAFDDLGAPLSEATFVVVDLETTGGAPGPNSITEFGAVKVRGGEVVGEFATLVNPGEPISPFITHLTGITTAMVVSAPRISQVLPSFLEFLGSGPETVLVAHNARFDVGHLKAACAHLDMAWPRVRVVDTVKLARKAFTRDEAPNAKLSTLARLCGAATQPTHRALDDARATVDVLHAILARLGPLGVTHVEDLDAAADPVPPRRRRKAYLAEGLVKGPGVYRFIGPAGDVLYVGTSVNVYKRVRQYFTAAESRKRMAEMIDLAVRVEATATATTLEAGVLELRQIVEFDPPYNRRSKRPDRRPWLVLTSETHPRLSVTRTVPLDDVDRALGPFTTQGQARRAAQLISDYAHLRTCTTRLPRVASQDATACHLHELGRCTAPCLPGGTSDASCERARRILCGAYDDVWESQMAKLGSLARQQRFEKAASERDKLGAVLSTGRRKEILAPLLRSSEIVAARRREDSGWDIAIVRYGRLAGSALAPAGTDPVAAADTLREVAEPVERPKLAGGAAHIEETGLLAAWLCHADTRLIDFSQEVPLALPRRSAARFDVPWRERPAPDE
ncbi:MAG: DEDD exonuclease domain-containing protein [Actinomycetaceae bacterium]|nr:DEDD exonuclease domain-containing protein [Actinomycetaceae bacterium]